MIEPDRLVVLLDGDHDGWAAVDDLFEQLRADAVSLEGDVYPKAQKIYEVSLWPRDGVSHHHSSLFFHPAELFVPREFKLEHLSGECVARE